MHSVEEWSMHSVDRILSRYDLSIIQRLKDLVANSKFQSARQLWLFMMNALDVADKELKQYMKAALRGSQEIVICICALLI